MNKKSNVKHIALLFLTTLIVYGCSNEHTINSDFLKESTYSTRKQKELCDFLQSFDMMICKSQGMKTRNLEYCYHSFFRKYPKNIFQTFSKDSGIPAADIKKTKDNLSPNLQEDLWRTFIAPTIRGIDSLLNYYPINTKGKYFDFMIKSVSKESNEIKKIVDAINTPNKNGPIMYEEVINNYKNFNIEDEGERLFLAIHYFERIETNAILRRQFQYKKNNSY